MGFSKKSTVSECISRIQSGHRVFVQGGVATPQLFLKELVVQANRLKNVELVHLHTCGGVDYADIRFKDNFRITNLFIGAGMRKLMDLERIDYLPCFLSEIPQLFRSKRRPLDIALIHVSAPDAHGYCSLGTNVDVTKAAIEVAPIILAQINPKMPRVHGEGMIHLNEIDHWVEVDQSIPECPEGEITPEERKIGEWIATLVEDGATLQVGIGSIPEAALHALVHHKDLGLHTELWTDAAMDLLIRGAINNSKKKIQRGKTVSGFVQGTQRLYDFIHDNPSVIQMDIAYVNNPHVISKNPKVTAINSAVEVDLTGQICSDSIGSRVISGVGGQMDFIRGASLSEGGKPIIALTSRTHQGKSKLVSQLTLGAGVVTTRAHVHYVITEYGIADLYGKTLAERSQSLINIAHPDDREALSKSWHAIQKGGNK